MEMFSPVHAERGLVEGVGENLGTDNGAGECARDVATAAGERALSATHRRCPASEKTEHDAPPPGLSFDRRR